MKKINATIRNKTELIIEEDAKAGDFIDLAELSKVDFTAIEHAIESGKDTVYQAKLNEKSKLWEAEKNIIIEKLNNKIAALTVEKNNEVNTAKSETKNEYIAKIAELNEKIKYVENTSTLALQAQLAEQKLSFEKLLRDKDDIINGLNRDRASMNVKQTGEDLETWCNNTVIEYMQNGLQNCTWVKDNKVIKDESEYKGSKADFIFKIFTTEEHKEEGLLTSVCLEMKDENPDSKNKQSNESFYKQLDLNRNKKGCKYAVLVSNLEIDKPNAVPIWKVRDYEDMYVVRPAYMMTLLNMITSLTVRFQKLVLEKHAEQLEIKDKMDMVAEFEDIKNTYLEKPLKALVAQIEVITNANSSIIKCADKIDEACTKITKSYINEITEKLSKFNVKIEKEYKKLG